VGAPAPPRQSKTNKDYIKKCGFWIKSEPTGEKRGYRGYNDGMFARTELL
jgi:hypothetical protein